MLCFALPKSWPNFVHFNFLLVLRDENNLLTPVHFHSLTYQGSSNETLCFIHAASRVAATANEIDSPPISLLLHFGLQLRFPYGAVMRENALDLKPGRITTSNPFINLEANARSPSPQTYLNKATVFLCLS